MTWQNVHEHIVADAFCPIYATCSWTESTKKVIGFKSNIYIWLQVKYIYIYIYIYNRIWNPKGNIASDKAVVVIHRLIFTYICKKFQNYHNEIWVEFGKTSMKHSRKVFQQILIRNLIKQYCNYNHLQISLRKKNWTRTKKLISVFLYFLTACAKTLVLQETVLACSFEVLLILLYFLRFKVLSHLAIGE